MDYRGFAGNEKAGDVRAHELFRQCGCEPPSPFWEPVVFARALFDWDVPTLAEAAGPVSRFWPCPV
jgi:hypothetical protein